jgi:hypothetical protein
MIKRLKINLILLFFLKLFLFNILLKSLSQKNYTYFYNYDPQSIVLKQSQMPKLQTRIPYNNFLLTFSNLFIPKHVLNAQTSMKLKRKKDYLFISIFYSDMKINKKI